MNVKSRSSKWHINKNLKNKTNSEPDDSCLLIRTTYVRLDLSLQCCDVMQNYFLSCSWTSSYAVPEHLHVFDALQVLCHFWGTVLKSCSRPWLTSQFQSGPNSVWNLFDQHTQVYTFVFVIIKTLHYIRMGSTIFQQYWVWILWVLDCLIPPLPDLAWSDYFTLLFRWLAWFELVWVAIIISCIMFDY